MFGLTEDQNPDCAICGKHATITALTDGGREEREATCTLGTDARGFTGGEPV